MAERNAPHVIPTTLSQTLLRPIQQRLFAPAVVKIVEPIGTIATT